VTANTSGNQILFDIVPKRASLLFVMNWELTYGSAIFAAPPVSPQNAVAKKVVIQNIEPQIVGVLITLMSYGLYLA
jgi:hypothetical protein